MSNKNKGSASASNQRASMLKRYKKAGRDGVTNLEFIQEDNILCPAKRTSEMRAQGIKIKDRWETWLDKHGRTRRVKHYFLVR